MILTKTKRKTFSKEEKLIWDCILRALKSNFVFDPKFKDQYIALKGIEEIKTLPHIVAMFLCYYYDVPLELMCLHFDLSEQKYEEYKGRLTSGVYKNESKLLRKIKLCRTWIERNTEIRSKHTEEVAWFIK